VRVTILPERRTAEVEARTVADLLATLKLHQDAYLVVRSDEILTRDIKLARDDQIEIWPVISGGARR
jgi:sulfur carrier protein ThiS